MDRLGEGVRVEDRGSNLGGVKVEIVFGHSWLQAQEPGEVKVLKAAWAIAGAGAVHTSPPPPLLSRAS